MRILKLAPNRDIAISKWTPNGISGVAGDSRTRMLNDPLPGAPIRLATRSARMVGTLDLPNSASKRIELPLRPCSGVSPSRPRAKRRGVDCGPATSAATSTRRTSAGRDGHLPVFHPGALFYFGDFHALQGDGEIVGSGLESTADVTFQFDLIKGKRIRWPRIENDEYIMVAGSVRPLIDALRIAYVELIEWLVADYGFERWSLPDRVAGRVVRVANVVDPNYTVIAKFPKRLLPKR